jgi:hypothetical protein
MRALLRIDQTAIVTGEPVRIEQQAGLALPDSTPICALTTTVTSTRVGILLCEHYGSGREQCADGERGYNNHVTHESLPRLIIGPFILYQAHLFCEAYSRVAPEVERDNG